MQRILGYVRLRRIVEVNPPKRGTEGAFGRAFELGQCCDVFGLQMLLWRMQSLNWDTWTKTRWRRLHCEWLYGELKWNWRTLTHVRSRVPRKARNPPRYFAPCGQIGSRWSQIPPCAFYHLSSLGALGQLLWHVAAWLGVTLLDTTDSDQYCQSSSLPDHFHRNHVNMWKPITIRSGFTGAVTLMLSSHSVYTPRSHPPSLKI